VTEKNPLTHHEILRLVEPFTRRDRHVDLSASNRLERRLVFKPVVRASETPGCDGACEILQLDNPRSQIYRLTRALTVGDATAKLIAEGEDPGELLARIEAVPPERQFRWVAAIPIALSYRLDAKARAGEDAQPAPMTLTAAQARIGGLALAVKADTGKGYPAEIELSPQPEAPLDLPEDLLATLGWDWRVLRKRGAVWTGTLRAPGREPRRSRHIESAVEKTVAHLARTLAEPPRRFHDRLRGARWTVVFRRLIPLLATFALLAGGVALSFADLPQDSLILMMTFNFPPVMLFMMFAMREIPRFEIPPFPRASNAPSWFPPSDGREAPASSLDLK